MAGIYLHIPFCKQACHYCNFHFTTSLRYKEDLVKALAKEAGLQKEYLQGQTVNTIYFGGGTPSLLQKDEYELLLAAIANNYAVAPDAEITLEANPDDIQPEKLASWKQAGINRLSIGIQSFYEEELRWMNRAHNQQQAKQCIEDALAAGFTNMTIDLIYGSPLLTDKMWEKNVKTAIAYNIPHLSCYALTVEDKTPLQKQINQHKKEPVDGDKQAHQFLLLMNWLKQAGYEHYEVSNFAKPGFRSRHNSAYWQGISYLGLGPSAHSYNGKERKWNVANNTIYIEQVNKGIVPAETEILSETNQLNEFLMISLRTMEGLNLEKLRKHWGEAATVQVEKQLLGYLQRGLVYRQNKNFALTSEGMLQADGIAASLFQ